jgi:HD-GYP domain-containing protein (c-di-GMP phosphodiesterase class II)
VGKIAVSQDILVKKEPLTHEEFELLKKHPVIGVNILKDIRFLEKEIPIILHHHERWDGRGYPHGLKGREIPLGARIMAVADAFDAMASGRGYKDKVSLGSVIAELKRGSGTQFAPEVVDVFVVLLEKRLPLAAS